MFKQYLKDTSGQFAIMFAVCATALLIAIGSAVDVLGIQKERNNLQSITDAAVLAAAVLKTDKIGDLKKAAEATLASNYSGKGTKLSVSVVGDIIRVEGSGSYNTQLMGIVGFNKLPVSTTSEAPIPKDTPLNIALVLDTTKSMEGSNMTALQSASKKLLEIFTESDPGTIQAGVIPFGEYVNVGLSNRGRPWMDVADDYETCYMRKPIISQDCTTSPITTETCYNDSGAYSCDKSSTTCTNQVYGPEYEYCYMTTWNGCVGSRDAPDHLAPEYKGKQFPGVMGVTCDNEILDLTSNLAEVNDHIDNLVANKWTYTPSGLAWGWRMLDPDIPYGGLTNKQSNRKRALILMSDGANSVRLQAPYHYQHNGPMSDTVIQDTNKLTTDLCSGIKDDGIDIYSVAYNLPTAEASAEQVIKSCATGPSYFFSAANQAELDQAFEDIARSLFEVRLSK